MAQVERLEELFTAAELKVVKKKKKEAIKTLLDAKRAQNLGIFKSGFKVPMYELEKRLAILPPSSEALLIEHVQALKKLGPTPEEREAYDRCGIAKGTAQCGIYWVLYSFISSAVLLVEFCMPLFSCSFYCHCNRHKFLAKKHTATLCIIDTIFLFRSRASVLSAFIVAVGRFEVHLYASLLHAHALASFGSSRKEVSVLLWLVFAVGQSDFRRRHLLVCMDIN